MQNSILLKHAVFLHHRNHTEAKCKCKGVLHNRNNTEAKCNHKGVLHNRNNMEAKCNHKEVMHNSNRNKGVLHKHHAEAMCNLNKRVMCNINCNINRNKEVLFMLHLLLHVEAKSMLHEAKVSIASAEMATMFTEVDVHQLC